MRGLLWFQKSKAAFEATNTHSVPLQDTAWHVIWGLAGAGAYNQYVGMFCTHKDDEEDMG